MSEMYTVEDARLAVDEHGELWISAKASAIAVQAAVNCVRDQHLISWNKREREWQTEHKESVEAHIIRLDQLWREAENRCAKLDRAEEAMREYEQTIGDQQKIIIDLENKIRWMKTAKKSSTQATAEKLKPRKLSGR